MVVCGAYHPSLVARARRGHVHLAAPVISSAAWRGEAAVAARLGESAAAVCERTWGRSHRQGSSHRRRRSSVADEISVAGEQRGNPSQAAGPTKMAGSSLVRASTPFPA
ncbi:unnamed protein product [Urochloa humidicola]